MSVSHLGSKTLGAVSIGVTTLTLPQVLQYLSELLSQQAELVARLDAYASIQVSFTDPATLIAQLQAALAGFSSQLAAIAAGALPTIGDATLSINADLAGLGLRVAALRDLTTQLEVALSAGGLHAFSVDSTAATVGAELAAQTAGGMPGGGLPNARVRGVVLLTEDPATYTALSSLLLTS